MKRACMEYAYKVKNFFIVLQSKQHHSIKKKLNCIFVYKLPNLNIFVYQSLSFDKNFKNTFVYLDFGCIFLTNFTLVTCLHGNFAQFLLIKVEKISFLSSKVLWPKKFQNSLFCQNNTLMCAHGKEKTKNCYNF